MSRRGTHEPLMPDFQRLFESAPGLYLVLDPGSTIVAASDAYLRATMTERGGIVGRNLFDVFPDNPDDPAATGEANLRSSLARVLAHGRPDAMVVQKYDIRRPEADGGGFEERHWSPVNSPVLGKGGAVDFIIHRVEDVTDFVRAQADGRAQHDLAAELRVRTEELERMNDRLAESESRYRLLFEASPQPMFVYARDTLEFLAVNQAMVRHYGWSADEFRAMTLRDIRPAEDLARMEQDLTHDRDDLVIGRERRHLKKDGTRIVVEVASHLLKFGDRDAALVLSTDVTRRKQLEAELRQSQKMEAVGLLAGGVAHDFNNMLTAIMGYAQLMRPRLVADAEALADADEILRAAERAANLTRQLLAFSRQQVLAPRVLDLNAILSEMDRMIRRLIGEDVDLRTAVGAELGSVRVDPGQIEQVVMNLVVNARDAMPGGGKLTIETANVDLDAASLRGSSDLAPGRFVMIAVSEAGCGMDAETAGRIFEPFFTTKETGRGTGLGLSTVHGIVKQSGGHVEVYSELGNGTTFKVYLPRVDEAAVDAPKPLPACGGATGGETILLVEGEEVIRRVVVLALTQAGYRVLACEDAGHALAMCEDKGQALDLLITDVVMPRMSGPQLVRRVAPLRPELPVLYISGYTDHALIH